MRAKGKNQQPNQPTCIDRIGGRTQAATTCEEAGAPTPLSKVLRNSPMRLFPWYSVEGLPSSAWKSRSVTNSS